MRTILFLSAVLLIGLVSCSNPPRTPSVADAGATDASVIDMSVTDVGVINGVRWATHNVDTPGTFTENYTDAGGFFNFERAQSACPQGWRLPRGYEWQSLVNAGSVWVTKNGVTGRFFGTAPNRIFLPAAGMQSSMGGRISSVGTRGFYWSSSNAATQDTAVALQFVDSGNIIGSNHRVQRYSVRCVAE